MTTIEIELLLRPTGGTAVSHIAKRLQAKLTDARTDATFDHRVVREDILPSLAITVAPAGSDAWSTDTASVWSRVEWTERHGTLPVAFELRVPVDGQPQSSLQLLGSALARFISDDLHLPVSWSVIDGHVPWPVRTSNGMQLRFCFPTRVLPIGNQPPVLDRSGQPSGFGGRLHMVTNTHLMRQFERRVGDEFRRRTASSSPGGKPVSRPVDFPFDDVDLFDFQPGKTVVVDDKLHPHVTRLRREGPRGSTVMELRDFELALGFASTVEDALRDVTEKERRYDGAGERQARLQTQLLDHGYLLDCSRRRRADAKAALEGLQAKKTGLFHFFRGRMEIASLVRERHHREMTLANTHVQELKATIGRLQGQLRVGLGELAGEKGGRDAAREELRVAVRALHAADPRVLQHLLGILSGPERASLKAAMARVVPVEMPTEGEGAAEDTRAGPPAKPSRGRKP